MPEFYRLNMTDSFAPAPDSQQHSPAAPAEPMRLAPPPKRRRLVLWLVILALAAAGGALAWRYYGRPVAVVLVAPTRGPAVEAVYATGSVEAVDSARIGSLVAGRIATLAVDEGAQVTRGQALGQIDDAQARQRLADAQAHLAMAQQELSRAQVLVRQNIRSEQSLQQSQEIRDRALAQVALMDRQLEDYRVTAPLDGIITLRPVEPGETVAVNAPLFTIADPTRLRVAAAVDERDIAQVRMGAEVAVRADAWQGESFPAKVTNIRRQGDTTTRTFRVEADMPAGSKLMIGMTVDVNIVVAERTNALLVPAAAIRHAASVGGRPGPASVFVVRDGAARAVPVKTGASGPAQVEITDGLAEDARIIAPLPDKLTDGQRVTVTTAPKTTP